MAKSDARPIKPEKPKPFMVQLIFTPLVVLMKLTGGLLIAMVASVVIEWVGMAMQWWPATHAFEMFSQEYKMIDHSFNFSITGHRPVLLVNDLLKAVTNWTHNTYAFQYIFSGLTGYEVGFFGTIKKIVHATVDYMGAAGYVFLTIFTRVVIFFLSTPWFVLCGAIGLIDGLIEREIRKYEGGIEHAWIYHMSKSHLGVAITIGWIVYLGMPFAIHPSLILIPAGIFFGMNIYVTAWSFKKFL